MNDQFELALTSSGQEYLNLELDLRRNAQADSSQTERLRRLAASQPDPVARLLAQVILDWIGPKGMDFKAALDYLDYVQNRFKRTVIGYPPPIGVEAYLSEHFADRLAELLALRLLKETGSRHWKVAAVTLYLKAHRRFTATSALLRFAIETDEPNWRELALDAVRAIQDPDLGVKLAFEVARARKLGRKVPAEVRSLAD